MSPHQPGIFLEIVDDREEEDDDDGSVSSDSRGDIPQVEGVVVESEKRDVVDFHFYKESRESRRILVGIAILVCSSPLSECRW